MSDSFSLQQFRQGNKNAFKKVFDAYYQGLVLFGKKYLNDIQVAEDIVQESFVALWNKREEIYDLDKIKAFLYVSVRNRSINYIRDRALREDHHERFMEDMAGMHFYENTLIEEETWRILMTALDRLSEQGRNVCLMSLDGMKNAEIAEALNLSLSTVKYHKSQAKILIKQVLKSSFVLHLLLFALE